MHIEELELGRRAGSRRLWLALTVIIVLGAAAGAVGLTVRAKLDPGEPVIGVNDVAVHDDKFGPAAIEIPAGTTVTWRWDGNEEHNVVGDVFKSPTQADGTFVHTFAEPGTYEYRCSRHYFMRGEVVVVR
jgi:plastocyanin